jgi:hypothetical protein
MGDFQLGAQGSTDKDGRAQEHYFSDGGHRSIFFQGIVQAIKIIIFLLPPGTIKKSVPAMTPA